MCLDGLDRATLLYQLKTILGRILTANFSLRRQTQHVTIKVIVRASIRLILSVLR